MLRRSTLVLLVLSACTPPVWAQNARLIVTVVDQANAPLPDAHIEVLAPDPRRAPTLIASGATDALGEVVLTVEPFRAYQIRVRHAGFKPLEPQPRTIWPFAGDVAIPFLLVADVDARRTDIRAGASPPPVRKGILTGLVVSLAGKPLANVPVLAHSGADVAHTRTEADGSYRFALNDGTYEVSAGGDFAVPPTLWSSPTVIAYERDAPVRAAVQLGRQTRADIILTPIRLFGITVTVIDDRGEVVPNADVYVAVERQNWSGVGDRRTGTDGSLKMSPVLPGPVRILVKAAKDDRSLGGSAVIEVTDAPVDVTIPLVESSTITGRVEFLGRVDPLHDSDGLHVFNRPPDMNLGRSNTDPSGLVRANGEFIVYALGEQCLFLEGIPSGWRLLDITYNDGDYTQRPFVLESGQNLSGVVIRVEPNDPNVERPTRSCSR